jgi:hypothetical protein
MLLFAAAAMADSTPQQVLSEPTRASVQARATVRIVAGARLSWTAKANADQPAAHTTVIHTVKGSEQARLIEFE